jgi:hypothetical protein
MNTWKKSGDNSHDYRLETVVKIQYTISNPEKVATVLSILPFRNTQACDSFLWVPIIISKT